LPVTRVRKLAVRHLAIVKAVQVDSAVAGLCRGTGPNIRDIKTVLADINLFFPCLFIRPVKSFSLYGAGLSPNRT
jgi:hypothetical protein